MSVPDDEGEAGAVRFDPLMAMPQSWEDGPLLTRHLARALLGGRLALVLGAGVSVPFGLPDWDTLLAHLYKHADIPRPEKEKRPERIEREAEEFRQAHFRRHRAKFLEAVHRALYEGFSDEAPRLRGNATLAAIAALAIMASRRNGVANVVTFNFDDLLESYLELHGFAPIAHATAGDWAGGGDAHVHHLHGLLPFAQRRRRRSEDIVLDELSFNEVTGRDEHPLRREVLNIMRRHVCLLVGLSGNDGSLGSLLADCKREHAAYREGWPYWGVVCTAGSPPGTESFWHTRGVAVHTVADFERALPEFLFSICRTASDMYLSGR